MNKKSLSHYLDLMKSAIDKQEYNKAKRYGETALKKLLNLSYSPFEKYLLYSRLGYAYYQIAKYSHALDMYYTSHLIASKHHLAPEEVAYSAYMLGVNFLNMRRLNQAIVQLQKVNEYFHRYGDNIFPMDKNRHFEALVCLGIYYLFKGETEKVEEIIYEKLQPYQNIISDLRGYYHLKGDYLVRLKEYDQARQVFKDYIKLNKYLNYAYYVCVGEIELAIIDLLEGKLESAISILDSLYKNKDYLQFTDLICETGLILSKCYTLKNPPDQTSGRAGMPDKTRTIENRIKPLLNKLDITWLYEKTREFKELFRQLQGIYKPQSSFNVPEIITNTLNQHNESSKYTIIGKSKEMVEIYTLIEKIAPTDLPVLIQGETGTGKELIARAIHNNSLRKENEWLALNCGAVTETLLENELFGHTKGAFTDALRDKKGYIELASEGTLFLDEITEMTPNMQQKLLRVLEEKLIWRLGSEKPVQVNTRFVFACLCHSPHGRQASNQNIEELVKTKKFREDLYYRINTIVITLPPLRDRKDDIPLLVKHFLKKIDERKEMKEETLKLLMDYNWPGNVRELENEIKRICTLYPNDKEITENMLSESIRNPTPKTLLQAEKGLGLTALKDEYEKELIIESLKKTNGNITKASQLLHYPRCDLYKKIRRLNIPLQ